MSEAGAAPKALRVDDLLERLARAWPWLIIVYFAGQALLRVSLFPILAQDEAQQVLFAQDLRLGYDEQPALYTWIVYLLFQLFGISVVALAALKALLLTAFHLFTYATMRRLASPFAAMLASASLFLIPQIGWGMQRDLTHTVLMMTALSAFVFFLVRLPERRGWLDYVGLCLAFAVGLLAKPNVLLGAGIALVVMLSLGEMRRRVNLGALAAALVAALALAAPSYLWILDHVTSTPEAMVPLGLNRAPLGSLQAISYGLFIMAKALVLNLCILFFAWWALTTDFTVQDGRQPFARVFLMTAIVGVAVSCVLVLASGMTQIRVRYLLPVLYFLALWAPLAYAEGLTQKWQRWLLPMLGLVAVLTITVSLALAFRFAPDFGMKRRTQAPFGGFVSALEEAGCRPDAIIAPREFIAGNLRFLYPEIPASAFNFIADLQDPPRRPLMVRWAWVEAEPLEALVERMGLAIPSGAASTITEPMMFTQPPFQPTMTIAYYCEPLAGAQAAMRPNERQNRPTP